MYLAVINSYVKLSIFFLPINKITTTKKILIYLVPLILLTSYVSKKKFLKMTGDDDLAVQKMQGEMDDCYSKNDALQAELAIKNG